MASPAVHVMAGLKSSPDLDEADLSISFIPLAIEFVTGVPKMHSKPGITLGGNCMRPDSRGRLLLRSTDPHEKPRIDHRLLSDERDVEKLVWLGKFLERVFQNEPLSRHVVGNNTPQTLPTSEAEWVEWVRSTATIGYHAVGTCRMGGDDAVLDPTLKVRGVDRLRVVDASVMPCIVSGNTNAATIAIAERAADLIVQDL